MQYDITVCYLDIECTHIQYLVYIYMYINIVKTERDYSVYRFTVEFEDSITKKRVVLKLSEKKMGIEKYCSNL